jgi:hypothetical protein
MVRLNETPGDAQLMLVPLGMEMHPHLLHIQGSNFTQRGISAALYHVESIVPLTPLAIHPLSVSVAVSATV